MHRAVPVGICQILERPVFPIPSTRRVLFLSVPGDDHALQQSVFSKQISICILRIGLIKGVEGWGWAEINTQHHLQRVS